MSHPTNMQIDTVPYKEWPVAYRCQSNGMEMIVVASIGPRIISLRCEGGDNLLYEDSTDMRVGDWRLYGGHRFTTAPESQTSYLPDNDPCTIEIGDNCLAIHQPRDLQGLQKSLLIEGHHEGGFELRHLLTNRGELPWNGSIWSLTCVRPEGQAMVSWGAGQGCWRNRMVRSWGAPLETALPATQDHCRFPVECLIVTPNSTRGKIGLYSDRGLVAWKHASGAFTIRSSDVFSEEDYPDHGCNLEVFNDPNYLELETLSPFRTLYPGDCMAHGEIWGHAKEFCLEEGRWPVALTPSTDANPT